MPQKLGKFLLISKYTKISNRKIKGILNS